MNDNVHGLLGAYAVDAVSPSERAAFEAHLPGCEDCSLELATLLETTAVLADAETLAPPAALRLRVMDQIAQTAQLPPSGEGSGDRPIDPPVSLAAARASRRVWPRMALAAASVAVLAVAGVVGGGLIAQRNADLALEKDVMMVASAPDSKSMDLGLGSAHLVMSDRMDSVVAMGDDCPLPKDGMEYQLWVVMEDGSKHAGPTFVPDSDGTFMTMMDGMGMDGVVAFAVTEEPRGGSDQPTSDAVAVVDL